MGACKQLLPIPDRPVVVRCVETILGAGITDPVVVIGPGGEGVAKAMAGFPVTLVLNDDPESDMAGSVRVGLAAVNPDAEKVFVCLCDHPLVSSETLSAMVLHGMGRPGVIVIPCHEGKKGHPTLFPRSILEEIGALATLRDAIARHNDKVSLLHVDDVGAVLDMDTPEDYLNILNRIQH